MKVINVISFLEINTLALLIVPCLADSLPYFCKDMDLCLAYNMEEHHGIYTNRVLELD